MPLFWFTSVMYIWLLFVILFHQLNLKKKNNLFISGFSLYNFSSLTVYQQSLFSFVLLSAWLPFLRHCMGLAKKLFIRYYEKIRMNFLGNPIVSLNPDSLFPFVTISLWKMNSLLPPEALFLASLLLSASISDFSWFPQRWPLPHFSPSCCFMAGEVGKD